MQSEIEWKVIERNSRAEIAINSLTGSKAGHITELNPGRLYLALVYFKYNEVFAISVHLSYQMVHRLFEYMYYGDFEYDDLDFYRARDDKGIKELVRRMNNENRTRRRNRDS